MFGEFYSICACANTHHISGSRDSRKIQEAMTRRTGQNNAKHVVCVVSEFIIIIICVFYIY